MLSRVGTTKTASRRNWTPTYRLPTISDRVLQKLPMNNRRLCIGKSLLLTYEILPERQFQRSRLGRNTRNTRLLSPAARKALRRTSVSGSQQQKIISGRFRWWDESEELHAMGDGLSALHRLPLQISARCDTTSNANSRAARESGRAAARTLAGSARRHYPAGCGKTGRAGLANCRRAPFAADNAG